MHGVKSSCQIYWALYWDWVNENSPQRRQQYYQDILDHRASCRTCRTETAELTRLASQAVMPEIDVKEATR